MKNSRKTAHLLRQAFESSRLADNEFKDLKATWRVKEEIDSLVCTRRPQEEHPELVIVEEVDEVVEEKKAPTISIPTEAAIPFPKITRIEEVVGACLENAGKALLFPNFKPSDNQLLILSRWGETYNTVFHYTDNKLTARPIDPTT